MSWYKRLTEATNAQEDHPHADRSSIETFQNFKEDPNYGKGWTLTRKRLAEDLYRRVDKTSLRNGSHVRDLIEPKG